MYKSISKLTDKEKVDVIYNGIDDNYDDKIDNNFLNNIKKNII